MKIKAAWAVQSFLLCFIFNLAFTAVIFLMAGKILEAFDEWVSALTGSGGAAPREDVQTALASLGTLVAEVRGYLLTVLVLLASAFTLLMWFFLFHAGSRQIKRAGERAGLSSKPEAEVSHSGKEAEEEEAH